MKPHDILHFWFNETDPKLQFAKDEKFDALIRSKFLKTYEKIQAGETNEWRQTPEGRLAEVIVLDQFTRNMFRDTPAAFAGDALALKLAQEAVAAGDDQKLSIQQRGFLYMPYMHSEDSQVHQEAMKLFSQQGLEGQLEYEILHKKIIDRFGRYPHRNKILGRNSTPEEIAFLKEKNSSF